MTPFDGLAERISAGGALSEADARTLVATTDLIALASVADDIRRQRRGVVTTFVRVLEIHVEIPPASLPRDVSAGEVRIVGSPATEDAAIAAVRAVAALAGPVPVTGFSLRDLVALASGGEALTRLCGRLTRAGLAAVAEMPIDQLSDGAGAVRAARDGGLAVLRMVVQSPPGDDPVMMVRRADDLQRAVGGFRAFAPLARTISVAAPTTGYDDVKQVAIARLMLADVPSIQVDWALYGPKLAQVALTMGADDVDSVAAYDPSDLGRRRSAIEEITRNIQAAGLQPSERDALFNAIGR